MSALQQVQDAIQIGVSLVLDPHNQVVMQQFADQVKQLAVQYPAGAAAATAGAGLVAGRAAQGIFQAASNAATNPNNTLGDTALFQRASGLVTDGFNGITDAALTLSRTGLRVLIAEFVAVGFAAEKIIASFIKVNQEFAGLEITLRSSFKSPEIAASIKDAITRIEPTTPIPFQGLSELTRAFAIMPQTRGILMNQAAGGGDLADPNGEFRKFIGLAEKMVAFRPEKTVADAIFSIREALGGEFRSLVRRFDIPLAMVAQFSGKSVKELKTDQPATLDALETLFNKIIDTDAIRQSVRQPDKAMRNIQTQLVDLPMLRIGDTGIYARIVTEMNTFLNKVKELNQQEIDPKTGQGIQGTSLIEKAAERIAPSLDGLLDGLKNTFNNLAEKILSATGFGAEKGGSLLSRALDAAVHAFDYLAKNLPDIVERFGNVMLILLPALAKLANLVLKFADQWLTWFSADPLKTFVTSIIAFQAIKNIPSLIMGALGMTRNYNFGGGSVLGPDLGGGIGTGPLSRFGRGATPTPLIGQGASNFLGGAASIIGAITLSAAVVTFSYEATSALREGLNKAGLLPRAFQSLDEQDAHDLNKASQGADFQHRILSSADMAQKGQSALTNYFKALDDLNANSNVRSQGNYVARQEVNDAKAALEKMGLIEADIYKDPERLHKYLDYATAALQNGRFLPPSQQDQDLTLKNLNSFFSTPTKKGGPFISQGESINSGLFANSLVKANAAAQGLDIQATNPGMAYIKAQEDKIDAIGDPMKDFNAKIASATTAKVEIANSIAKMNEGILNAVEIGQGEGKVKENIQKTINVLDEAVKSGKVSGDTQIDALGKTVKQTQDFYQKWLEGLSSGSETVGKQLQQEIDQLKARADDASAVASVSGVMATLAGVDQVLDLARKKTVYAGPQANAVIDNLKKSLSGLDQSVVDSVNPLLDQLKGAFAKPTDNKAKQELALAKGEEAGAAIYGALIELLKTISQKIKDGIAAIDTNGLLDITTGVVSSGFTGLSRGMVDTSGSIGPKFKPRSTLPTSSGGTTQDGALFNFNEDPTTVDPNLAPDVKQFLGVKDDPSATAYKQAQESLSKNIDQKVEILGNVQQHDLDKDAELKALGNKQATANFAKDYENQINESLAQVTKVLDMAQTVQKGPLAEYLKSDFSKHISDFPSLANLSSTSINALFAEVKTGDAGLDTLYDKIKATSEISKNLAGDLRNMAAAADSPESRKHYLAAADAQDLKAAQLSQQAANMDRAANPFYSFSDGLQQSLGTSAHAIGNLTELGKNAGTTISNSLGTAFGEFVTGTKSAKQAFSDMAASVIKSLAEMAAQAAAKQVLGLLFNFGSSLGGSGGGLGSLFGGGTASAATDTAALAFDGGFASGGYVTGGKGGIDDIPARLTAGEYVLTKEAVKEIGVSNLHRMNQGEKVRYFADGGFVGDDTFSPKKPSSHSPKSTASNGGTTFSINNTFTIGTSSDGKEDAIPPEQARAFGKLIDQRIQQIIIEESRPGGKLRKN